MSRDTTTRWHVVGTWRAGLNGDTIATRPAIIEREHEAEGRAEAMWQRIGVNAPDAEDIEITVHEVAYDVYFDEKRREDVKRETGRKPIGTLSSTGWSYPDDARPLKLERVTAWKELIQHDMRGLGKEPPVPPDHIRRQGADAVRAWYADRAAAADVRHAERMAAMRVIAE